MKINATGARFLLPILLMISTATLAQQHSPGERLQNARIALFTERLSLTPEKAERFWPVYNQIDEQRTALRQEGRQLQRASGDSLTNAQARARVEEYLDLRQRELVLEEAAIKKLRAVLSDRQVVQLLRAERDFQRMMLRQLGRRRGKRH